MGVRLERVNRSDTYAGHTTLEVEVCGVCGVLFAAPKVLIDHCRETGDNFFCPNGHTLVFDDYENARLKRQLASTKDTLAFVRADRDQTEARLRSTKGVVTKQKKKLARVAAGVCPCCNRSFQDLARHMETKHPDFAHQQETTE
jgi:hypothetical protein